MSAGAPSTPHDPAARLGGEIGVSGRCRADRAGIDRLTDLRGDRPIHVDPCRAAVAPFGGTVAHGCLSVSAPSILAREALPPLARTRMGADDGVDRPRVPARVPFGVRVRGRFALAACDLSVPGEVRLAWDARRVEVEGGTKPALVAHGLDRRDLEAEDAAA